ncbi:DUF1971 domain-containing protein [Sphingobium sp. CAP-1]|uniref:DUF1971 domain-containing protein n=1 Tax=Sphingobium sp. CAP-1 TaxID=2676077 RepID=UPI003FA6F5A3
MRGGPFCAPIGGPVWTPIDTRHDTKAGVWGVIRVFEGELRLTYLEPPSEIVLTPDQPGLILPQQPHFVTPTGPMKMQVDFYDHIPKL